MSAIMQQAQAAVNELFKTRVPSRTERSQPAAAASARGAGPVVSTRSSGYLGVDDQEAGSTLNPEAQLGLFVKIRKKSDWLRYTSFKQVSQSSGLLDTWTDADFRMKPTPSEAPRRGIPVHKPDVTTGRFSTSLMSGAFGIRLKALNAAKAAGQNVNQLVQNGIATGIGNVLADLAINGDSTLPTDSDLNTQRSAQDGWFKKIRDNAANYTSQDDGFGYHNGIWAGMLQQIDKAYRSDPSLAWGLSDTLGTRWLTELTATGASPSNAHPSIVNDLGSQLLNAMGARANPLGKTGIVIPQLDEDRWSSGEGYTGIAPTSVANNSDGTLTINVNTLATSGVNRGSSGADGQRYVTITCSLTGVSETLAISYSAPHNTVTTASLLGQTNPSTTAADYLVRWADTQSVFLGVYRHLYTVVQNGIRIYTVFYPHDEVMEVIVHMDLDFIIPDYEAVSLVDDIITPKFNVLP